MHLATSSCNPTSQENSPALCWYNVFVKFCVHPSAARATRLFGECPLRSGDGALSNLQLQLRMRQRARAAATGRVFSRHSGIVVTCTCIFQTKLSLQSRALRNPVVQTELSLQSRAHVWIAFPRPNREIAETQTLSWQPVEPQYLWKHNDLQVYSLWTASHTQMTFTVIECFRYLLRQPSTSCVVEMVRWKLLMGTTS